MANNYYCQKQDVLNILNGIEISEKLEDVIENSLIPSAEREIDRRCHQTFRLTEIKKFFDGTGTSTLTLCYRPVKELKNCILRVTPQVHWYQFKRWRHTNVVDIDGRVIAEEGGPTPLQFNIIPPYQPGQYIWEKDIEKADLIVDCVKGILTIPPQVMYIETQTIPFWNYTFLKGSKNVEVIWEYGYEKDNIPEDLKLACAKMVGIEVLKMKGNVDWGGATSISLGDYSKSASKMAYSGIIDSWEMDIENVIKKYRRLFI